MLVTQSTIDSLLKWTGCAATLTGALLTSLGWDPENIILLNLGALLYLWWSIRIREWSLTLVNGGLLTIYLFGAILRL